MIYCRSILKIKMYTGIQFEIIKLSNEMLIQIQTLDFQVNTSSFSVQLYTDIIFFLRYNIRISLEEDAFVIQMGSWLSAADPGLNFLMSLWYWIPVKSRWKEIRNSVHYIYKETLREQVIHQFLSNCYVLLIDIIALGKIFSSYICKEMVCHCICNIYYVIVMIIFNLISVENIHYSISHFKNNIGTF